MLALSLLVALTGCKKVEPAPAELDELFHFVWPKFDVGTPEELHEAVVNMHDAVDGNTLDEATDGSLTRLSATDAAVVGVLDRDPVLAAGIFIANVIDCDFELLQDILAYPSQDELYTGVYDHYQRAYTTSRNAWLDRSGAELTWDLDYSASIISSSYDASARGKLRRIERIDDELSPFGDIVLARAYLPEPATFKSDGRSLDQDYQLELYWERRPGEVVHTYAMWRQADFGSGFTSEDEGVQRILLNNLVDWDDTTAEICEEGLP